MIISVIHKMGDDCIKGAISCQFFELLQRRKCYHTARASGFKNFTRTALVIGKDHTPGLPGGGDARKSRRRLRGR